MRKKPTQQRAEKTVEIISEAAIQLLDTPVSPDFTTNHIAERAGVSVGTLYRYFPDKGAILRHIVRQELEMLREGLEEIIDSSDAKDAQNLLREVLEHTVRKFGGRTAVAGHVRKFLASEEDLQREIHDVRLDVLRKLHRKIVSLEPSRTNPLSDATLSAVLEAFLAAVRSLAEYDHARSANTELRLKLINSLLATFSE